MATKVRAKPLTTARTDKVMIRKSGSKQDEISQADNVTRMLIEQGINDIPKDDWFYCTIKRAEVAANTDFKRLMEFVRSNRVRTIYIEMQDRFGTDDVYEFFSTMHLLRQHRTRLFDLREKRDLTKTDDKTLMESFFGSLKSSKERRDLSYRTMRKKVPFFLETGSWPSGVHPFGYGKRCYAADGKTLLWEWQPTTRTTGQIFYPGKNGKLEPGPKDVGIPAKEKGRRFVTKLVPSKNKEHVTSVQRAFELFTQHGMSFRKISTQLNDAGRTFYGKPFDHTLVGPILRNPAYVGDTHYGKTICAAHYTCDTAGNMVAIESDEDTDDQDSVPADGHKKAAEKRPVEEQLVKKNTHKGLIDRNTWKLAQQRINDLEERPRTPPRNAEHYLKEVLVCGHCGKPMTGETLKNGDVAYMCSTYRSGKSRNQKVTCGAYRILHSDAERLLLDKLKEQKLQCDEFTGTAARNNACRAALDAECAYLDGSEREDKLIVEGIAALRSYYDDYYGGSAKEKNRFYEFSTMQYGVTYRDKKLFTEKFRRIVRDAEAEAVDHAKSKLATLQKRHTKLTNSWADATPMMREQLKGQAVQVEADMVEWQGRQKSIRERLQEELQTTHERAERYWKIFHEWPDLELRQKGESLRRIFKTVKLKWEAAFHRNENNPKRPRTTNRKGRFSYELQTDKIGWEFQASNLDGSS